MPRKNLLHISCLRLATVVNSSLPATGQRLLAEGHSHAPDRLRGTSLPKYLTVDTLTLDYFKRSLKCFLFARY